MAATHQHQSDAAYATAVWFWNDVSARLSDADNDDADADATGQISWVKALHSLECARRYLRTSIEARNFVDKYMVRLVVLSLTQDREKLESCDRDSIEAMLSCCLHIINYDIKAIDDEHSCNNISICQTLGALDYIFDTSSVYYKGSDSFPDVWYDLANEFRRVFDFASLLDSQQSLRTFFVLFWRDLALKLITSEGVKMKVFGWNQISYLLDEIEKMVSLPMAYEVKHAGALCVNGIYHIDSSIGLANGYVTRGVDLRYHRQVPSEAKNDAAGKVLTLSCYATKDGSEKWFMSEKDKEEPGGYEQVEYYSSLHDDICPPASGWNAEEKGESPAPILEPLYCKESIPLEYQLATWAVDVRLIDLSFKDLMHTEVVEPALKLIKFLVDMSLRFSSLPIIGGLSIRDYLRTKMNMVDFASMQSIENLRDSSYVRVVWDWNEIVLSLSKQEEEDNDDFTLQLLSWAKALGSLKCASRRLHSFEERSFVKNYMLKLVTLALKLDREDLEKSDRDCIEAMLKCCLQIVNDDIKENNDSNFIIACSTLDVLEKILDAKSDYYDEIDGLDDVWYGFLAKDFRKVLDFSSLLEYMERRATTDEFPPMSLAMKLLGISGVGISDDPDSIRREDDRDQSQDLAILYRLRTRRLTQVVMAHISGLKDSDFMTMNLEDIFSVRHNLQMICQILSESKPGDLLNFFACWRKMALKLVSSESLRFQLFGWDEIGRLVDECEKLRPPPRTYMVTGAGTDFVNGAYEFDSSLVMNSDCVKPGIEFKYQREVPSEGKVLTLLRCEMDDGREDWFLSEEDKDGEDVDYYQCVSKTQPDHIPPKYGWTSVNLNLGENPAPVLHPVGLVVPRNQEENTLEHQLAKWAIDSGLIALAFGESTNGEIIQKSSKMVKFLAEFHNEFCWLPAYYDDYDQFSLNQAHLDCAMDTCKATEDVDIVRQLYAMMKSIKTLPDYLYDRAWEVEKTAMLRRLSLNDPALLELQIGYEDESEDYDCESGVLYHPGKGAEFAMLGTHVGKNTNLETVRFYRTSPWDNFDTDAVGSFFGGLRQNTSIRSLTLQECNISEGKGVQLLSIFEERSCHLTEIELNSCSLGDNFHLLASTIRVCNTLKAIKLPCNEISDEELAELAEFMKGSRDLEILDLEYNEIGVSGCNTIASLLEDPLCNIITLGLLCNRIGDDGAIALSKAFPSNRSVVKLSLTDNDIIDDEVVFDSFSRVLCNESSINAIYSSNHTLHEVSELEHYQTFGARRLQDRLEMNSLVNKREVATRKILKHYSHIDMDPFFEWDLRMLPRAFGWFDRAVSYHDIHEEKEAIDKMKLTAIYQFMIAMPLLFVPACHNGNLKRKRSKVMSKGMVAVWSGSKPIHCY